MEVSSSLIELDGKFKLISVIEDITARKKAVEKIIVMANYDNLTGLPNRNFFMERLKQSFASADRNRTSVAIMFVDLDQFKAVNDSL